MSRTFIFLQNVNIRSGVIGHVSRENKMYAKYGFPNHLTDGQPPVWKWCCALYLEEMVLPFLGDELWMLRCEKSGSRNIAGCSPRTHGLLELNKKYFIILEQTS